MKRNRARLVLLATGAGLTVIAVTRARRACRRTAETEATTPVPSGGAELADRVRTALGPLERELDLPRLHVFADHHVVVLHGEVPSAGAAGTIEAAVGRVAGVDGVESHLRVGLLPGDSRPSIGRRQPSDGYRQLRDAALRHGAGEHTADVALRAVLGELAGALPEPTRTRVASHLPSDLAELLTPPRRVGARRRRETVAELLADVVEHDAFPKDRAPWVVEAVVGGLRALVPDDDRAVAAALPGDLRRIWEGTSLQLEPQAVSH